VVAVTLVTPNSVSETHCRPAWLIADSTPPVRRQPLS
jgi:hypothetical protein